MTQTYLCIRVCASCTYSLLCCMRVSSTLDQLQDGQRCWQGVWLEQAASPSFCHPCNVRLRMLVLGCHLVQGCYSRVQRFIYLLFLAIKKESDLSYGSLSCVDGMYNWKTKRFSFMYISSGMVSLFPRLEKVSSICRLAFFRLFEKHTLLFPLMVPV